MRTVLYWNARLWRWFRSLNEFLAFVLFMGSMWGLIWLMGVKNWPCMFVSSAIFVALTIAVFAQFVRDERLRAIAEYYAPRVAA